MASAFDFIAAEAITGQETARYRLIGLRINGGIPFLEMRPATEENTDYHRAGIRLDMARNRKLEALKKGQRKKRLTDDEAIEEALSAYDDQRKRDLDLFAEHVVVGWGIEYGHVDQIQQGWPGFKRPKLGENAEDIEGPMLDSKAKPVECTPENVLDFLKAVARRSANDWDLIRNFAKAAGNFRERMPDEEVEELAKNSPSGSSGS